MKLSLAVDRQLYGLGGARRYLWARIEVPRIPRRTQRPPLDLALVLDRSGSMGGSKITLARRAASLAAQLLRDSDRCGLVAYDDEVLRPVPCRPADAEQRAALLGALRSLEARGSTDLFGGWTAGAEEIASTGEAARVRRVLILTDGLANVGVTDPAEILHHVREVSIRGIGTSTIGVGLDFDEVLVSGMAEAGNGHFYYVERPEQIPDFLAGEVGELLTVAARSVTLGVTVSGPAQVQVHNLNDLPLLDARYQLGDLSEGAVIDVVFALDIPAGADDRLTVEALLSWIPAGAESRASAVAGVDLHAAAEDEARAESPHREALAQAVSAAAALTRTEAIRLNHRGEYERARVVAEAQAEALEAMAPGMPEAMEAAADLRSITADLAGPMPSAMSKSVVYNAYKARHSRKDRP